MNFRMFIFLYLGNMYYYSNYNSNYIEVDSVWKYFLYQKMRKKYHRSRNCLSEVSDFPGNIREILLSITEKAL